MSGQQTINEYGCEVGCTCTVCSATTLPEFNEARRAMRVFRDSDGAASGPMPVTKDQIDRLEKRISSSQMWFSLSLVVIALLVVLT